MNVNSSRGILGNWRSAFISSQKIITMIWQDPSFLEKDSKQDSQQDKKHHDLCKKKQQTCIR